MANSAYSFKGITLMVQWWLAEPGAPLQGPFLPYPIIREQVQRIRLHNGGISLVYFVLCDQYSIKQLRECQQETDSVLHQTTLPQFLLCKRGSYGSRISLTKPALVRLHHPFAWQDFPKMLGCSIFLKKHMGEWRWER